MSTTRVAGAGPAAALTAAFTLAAGTLVAAPAAHAATARSYLALSVRVGDKTRTATLRCDPPRGTHPKAPEACAALAGVKGDLTALKPAPGVMCTMIYLPAVAAATGTWRGRSVQYRHTYSNSCLLGVQTGPVFQF
jgi:hypothetical protein